MNILRTGNIVIDTGVSMLVPILFASISFFFNIFFPIFDYLLETFVFTDDTAFMSLEYEVRPRDSQNTFPLFINYKFLILFTSILLFESSFMKIHGVIFMRQIQEKRIVSYRRQS